MEGARALSVRGSQSSRKWHAVEPLGDERERKVGLVRRHHVAGTLTSAATHRATMNARGRGVDSRGLKLYGPGARRLHGSEGEVVSVGLHVARALRRGAVEVGGEPRLPRRSDGELDAS